MSWLIFIGAARGDRRSRWLINLSWETESSPEEGVVNKPNAQPGSPVIVGVVTLFLGRIKRVFNGNGAGSGGIWLDCQR